MLSLISSSHSYYSLSFFFLSDKRDVVGLDDSSEIFAFIKRNHRILICKFSFFYESVSKKSLQFFFL